LMTAHLIPSDLASLVASTTIRTLHVSHVLALGGIAFFFEVIWTLHAIVLGLLSLHATVAPLALVHVGPLLYLGIIVSVVSVTSDWMLILAWIPFKVLSTLHILLPHVLVVLFLLLVVLVGITLPSSVIIFLTTEISTISAIVLVSHTRNCSLIGLSRIATVVAGCCTRVVLFGCSSRTERLAFVLTLIPTWSTWCVLNCSRRIST
jgi:hypothetical protein